MSIVQTAVGAAGRDLGPAGIDANPRIAGHRRDDDPRAAAYREILGERPLRVLDVGSGSGELTLLLYSLGHFPQGIDLAADKVRRARERAASRCAAVPFHVGDVEQLDYPAGVFDAVHAAGVLGALSRPDWALAEWYRVLRPGGTLVVASADVRSVGPVAWFVRALRRAARALCDGDRRPGDPQRPLRDAGARRTAEFLRSVGFTDVVSRSAGAPRGAYFISGRR